MPRAALPLPLIDGTDGTDAGILGQDSGVALTVVSRLAEPEWTRTALVKSSTMLSPAASREELAVWAADSVLMVIAPGAAPLATSAELSECPWWK